MRRLVDWRDAGVEFGDLFREKGRFLRRPYPVCLESCLPVSGLVCGVTRCDNKLFVVCSESKQIQVIPSNDEPEMNIEGLEEPADITSCIETRHLYVAGWSRDHTDCVWRVSLDGRQVVKWLPNNSTTVTHFKPYTLSVTSRRLLVTSQFNKELLLYGADGVELKRVPLPDMDFLQHAVETSRGTFVVSHLEPLQPRVCEVNDVGHVTRVYSDQQQLLHPAYLSLDSDGRIFVADCIKHCVLLLNRRLKLKRVLLNKTQLNRPRRLCLTEHQLVIGCRGLESRPGQWSDFIQLFTVRQQQVQQQQQQQQL